MHLLYSRFFTKGIKKINNNLKISEPFKNLFTQGMVCHETYKDKDGEWLYPEETEKTNTNKRIKKKDKSKVIVGPPESMSKSKKNTIDPEIMIKQYGADAVRWFILSDSLKRMFNGLIEELYLQINFYKSFGTSVLC